jgi:geranylgeranyl pyrophosphate synthase
MKIGAILGNGDAETVASLGRFGYTYGVVSLVAEEFIDLMEYREFMNRLRNECPPLPVLYALLNEELRNIILPLLRTKRLPKEDFQEITKSVLEFQEVQQLKYQMHTLVEDCLSQMDAAAYSEQANREISALLRAISGSILCAVN